MAGKPLAAWTLEAAQGANCIDAVVISTDSEQIKEALSPFLDDNTFFFDRSQATASDTASTESALLEFFDSREAKNIVLIQATSPLLKAKDLDDAFEKMNNGNFDSILSVVRQHRFHWKENQDGTSSPLNYDPAARPRRQDHSGYLVENGAFYISSYENVIKNKNRTSGKIATWEMMPESFFEIDEPSDWEIVEGLLSRTKRDDTRPKEVKLVITDIDGVWTDAGMYYTEKGDELKKFNTRDGMGVQILREKGVEVAIITSENTKMVQNRAKKLKIENIFQGIKNKAEIVQYIQQKLSVSPKATAYIGDDINDLSVRPYVGYFYCPKDANNQVLRIADFVLSRKGGEGCFREMVENIYN